VSTLRALYAEADALYEGACCPRSTGCCRFRESGREPWLGRAEADAVLRAIAARGGRLPRGGGEGDCPLLRADGGCSIYADRPFGCRTFFCVDATIPTPPRRRELERLTTALRALSDATGDDTVAPLTAWLGPHVRSDGRLRIVR